MYGIAKHQLTYESKPVPQYPTGNMGGTMSPKILVIHYTAGPQDAHGTAKYFQNPASKVSAHLNVGEDGTITQSVPFNRVAWHAGVSSWAGLSGLNNHSIGIEVINPGPLERLANGRYKSWWGKIYSDDDYPIFQATHKSGRPTAYWIPFTEAQNEVLLEVGALLMNNYKLNEAVGHDMISPGRKTDPGPTMDDRIYIRLNGGLDIADNFGDYIINVNLLNVRSGPGTSHSIIGKLRKGNSVKFKDSSGDWLFVELENGSYGYIGSKFATKK